MAAVLATACTAPPTEFVPDDECSALGLAPQLIAQQDVPEGRDPSRWPFAVNSPWNTALGATAAFAPDDDPRVVALTDENHDAWVNAGEYSQPIYRAVEDDPLVNVRRKGCRTVRYRIPVDARPAAGDDAHLNVVDPTGRWVDESFGTGGEPPNLTTGNHVRNDLRGPGVGEGGARAYGGSAIGGLIRTWEVEAGEIRHVLAIALTNEQLGRGPVWPATAEDADAEDAYRGAVSMGTLVALPRSVDVEALDLDGPGLMLARALQDYGAYVVDRSGSLSLYAEPDLEPTPALGGMRDAIAVLRPLLGVVTDNGPRSVGGAGERRAEPAPPLR